MQTPKPRLTNPDNIKRLTPEIVSDGSFPRILKQHKVVDNPTDSWKEIMFAHAILGLPAALKTLKKLSIVSKHSVLVLALTGAENLIKYAYKKIHIEPYKIKF
jgi:hypothetical protein